MASAPSPTPTSGPAAERTDRPADAAGTHAVDTHAADDRPPRRTDPVHRFMDLVAEPDSDDERSQVARVGERLLRFAEDAVYVLVAVLLVVGAIVLLVDAAGELGGLGHGADTAVLALLDRLLLVFVLVELIFAVRMTLKRREIVAEPFLIVGIIASIKEIILLSVEAANVLEGKPTTEGGMTEPREFALLIALLGLLVVVLAASAVLLRLKERQPVEGQGNEEHSEDGPGNPSKKRVDAGAPESRTALRR